MVSSKFNQSKRLQQPPPVCAEAITDPTVQPWPPIEIATNTRMKLVNIFGFEINANAQISLRPHSFDPTLYQGEASSSDGRVIAQLIIGKPSEAAWLILRAGAPTGQLFTFQAFPSWADSLNGWKTYKVELPRPGFTGESYFEAWA